MEYLEEKKVGEEYKPTVDATGMNSITKFTSKQFGNTFSRVIKLVHKTVTVTETTYIDEFGSPQTVPCIKMPCQRVKDTIIIARYTAYPNKARSDWYGLQESALTPPVLGFGIGSSPFVGFQYQGYDLAIVYNQSSTPIGVGDRIVIQLLFIEL